MNRLLLVLGGIAAILVMGITVTWIRSRAPTMSEKSTSSAPEAKVERLTSALLLRRIDRLRDQAVYIQHREEGMKLLELLMPAEVSAETGSGTTENTESSVTGTGEVVEE